MALSCFLHQAQSKPGGPLAPRITSDIAIADDGIFDKALDVGPELFDASKSGCDVRIRTNRFVGDLHRYDITATIEEISVDIELTGQVALSAPSLVISTSAPKGKRGSSPGFLRCPTDWQAFVIGSALRNTAPPAADIMITIGATSPCKRSTTGTGRAPASVPRHRYPGVRL
jgi:hypothetical protein